MDGRGDQDTKNTYNIKYVWWAVFNIYDMFYWAEQIAIYGTVSTYS
jgi:hypothetical protein